MVLPGFAAFWRLHPPSSCSISSSSPGSESCGDFLRFDAGDSVPSLPNSAFADPLCPQRFREDACRQLNEFAAKVVSDRTLSQGCSHDTWKKWQKLTKTERGLESKKEAHWNVLRFALLDFIADFANWDNSTAPAYLETSRVLTQSAHEAMGGDPGTRPLVADPFAGGGSIPLEALRIGADVFASDLNPIPVLLNKVVLEYIPRYGQRLADDVRRWGDWIKREAEKELAEFYPKDPDGAMPVAYLWARTIQCEGPGCGAEVPLIRSLWLAKKGTSSVLLQLLPRGRAKRVDFQIIVKERDGWVDQSDKSAQIEDPQFVGTVKRGSATCPCCGYTTPVARIREQLTARRGGSNDARLFCVVKTTAGEDGRSFRLPSRRDNAAFAAASEELARRIRTHKGELSLVPDEIIPMTEIRRISVPIYGMNSWGDLFSARQALAISTLVKLLHRVRQELGTQDIELAKTVTTILSVAISRFTDICNALCMWEATKTKVRHMFTRQAIGMLWDYAEPNIFADGAGDFSVTLGTMVEVLERESTGRPLGHVVQASATEHPLPESSANALITDPPYYDAVPYAHLSDFFYVWLRRALASEHLELFGLAAVPKNPEIVVDRPHELSNSTHDISYYERELTKAFAEARRVLRPDGIGTIVFASKTTASWEAILKAVVDAGWIITGSWPIDTEMETRVSAQGQARLASSVHLVCRPREDSQASGRIDEVGDWRDVLQELPRRIHEWMPRLAQEGVVGADAIFSCLGPALEIFSRYSRVEKPNGEEVALKEYLEHVWAAVSKEAISMIFAGADTSGFEEDARLTAMWLWTLSPGLSNEGNAHADGVEDADEDSDDRTVKTAKLTGFTLEYDAARQRAAIGQFRL